jgi:spore germination protein YaaH
MVRILPRRIRRKRKQSSSGTPAKRKWLQRIAFGIAALLFLLLVDYFAYPYGVLSGAPTANRGENGLWLRYTWYFGEKSGAEVDTLAKQLQERQIKYAYFHVRHITKEGGLQYRYPDKARALTEAIHRKAPGVKLLAWIYAGNRAGQGEVDLTNKTVRAKMVSEAAWLVNKCGFDGVQWDYETCADSEPGFLPLLLETRAALPENALVSVAAPVWMPFPFGRMGWSEGYFTQVAAACDQLCVMCYDSGFWLPRSYAWLVHQQAVHITPAVARGNARCRMLLGIPTYGSGLISHNPRAENIGMALKGVCEGMADPQSNQGVFAGVAVFADYTTDADSWRTYDRLWLRHNE